MDIESTQRILTQLKNEHGEDIGTAIDIPIDVTVEKLQLICNAINRKEEEPVPFAFFINEEEITESLDKTLQRLNKEEITGSLDKKQKDLFSSEKVVEITCLPQAVYRVRSVTRCSSSIPGHSEPVISVAFSYDGRRLASGSGDTTVRFWDVETETPLHTCKGHNHWVLCIAWSPNGQKLASACKNGSVMIWNPESGEKIGSTLNGHRQWVNYLSWEPFHSDSGSRRLASAGKDGTIRIWDTVLGTCSIVLSSHTQSVTCVKWGGSGLIYSSSQDRSIRVWRASDGVLCRILEGHAHWVNTLALSTDYALRTSSFDPKNPHQDLSRVSVEERVKVARERYEAGRSDGERLVSGSDDLTLFLWKPESEKKSITRMTGHQQLINDVKFSPDTRTIASASFDKSIKLWDGKTGKFIASLRAHVQPVYQISWSSDSRLIVSASADSTLKVFDTKTKKIHFDLPGHADQVFAVDWSPDGERVVSGGKDKVLKVWRR